MLKRRILGLEIKNGMPSIDIIINKTNNNLTIQQYNHSTNDP